jgi:hypothetical protein
MLHHVIQSCNNSVHTRTSILMFFSIILQLLFSYNELNQSPLSCLPMRTQSPSLIIPSQRVVSDLWRAVLCRGRIIWLLANPPPPHFPAVSSTGDT